MSVIAPLESAPRNNSHLLTFVIAMSLSAGCAIALRIVTNNPLGLSIGALGLLSLITPPLALAVSRQLDRAMLAGAVALPMIVVLLTNALQVIPIILIFTLSLVAIAHALIVVRLPIAIASTITTLLALAWLTWPIWLASHISDQWIARLVAPHPIFAINGILPDAGVWTQQPIMYRLTTLGQDVPYAFPSIWPTLLLHCAIALLLLLPFSGRLRAGKR